MTVPRPSGTRTASVAASRAELEERLDGAARTWLSEALAEAAHAAEQHAGQPAGQDVADLTGIPVPPPARPAAWELRFASAGRHCGGEHAAAVRALLLRTARPGQDALARLYRYGDAAERRAVLLALPALFSGPEALDLVQDALRTHDTRLVAAAVGPYGAAHLDPHSWRHAVLKCLFTGVPVDAVAGLAKRARADAELARMLTDFAAERTAAGRPVPGDLHRVLALTVPPEAS
ncbi:EboA domain-containing protein [Streptomyces lichenis]|uniref:EboA domain-containing protein n=1 Tax=Streptomyces lichenis TaxID=2306967 RepID=A0ABT0IE57_9ACTN|nr:EboA domain-containing protein [Streptomyces lichenis]MCK8679612.1 EboA domain-containing protein [Streptomyces lichenis]